MSVPDTAPWRESAVIHVTVVAVAAAPAGHVCPA